MKNNLKRKLLKTKDKDFLDKYCPVALLTCGYMAKCIGNEGDCMLKKGVEQGICKGRVGNGKLKSKEIIENE